MLAPFSSFILVWFSSGSLKRTGSLMNPYKSDKPLPHMIVLVLILSLSEVSVEDSPNKYAEESPADSAIFTNCNGRVGLIISRRY